MQRRAPTGSFRSEPYRGRGESGFEDPPVRPFVPSKHPVPTTLLRDCCSPAAPRSRDRGGIPRKSGPEAGRSAYTAPAYFQKGGGCHGYPRRRYVIAAGGAERRAGASGRGAESLTGTASPAAASGKRLPAARSCLGAGPTPASREESAGLLVGKAGGPGPVVPRARTACVSFRGCPGRGGSGGDGPQSGRWAAPRRARCGKPGCSPAHRGARFSGTTPPSCGGRRRREASWLSRPTTVRTRRPGERGP